MNQKHKIISEHKDSKETLTEKPKRTWKDHILQDLFIKLYNMNKVKSQSFHNRHFQPIAVDITHLDSKAPMNDSTESFSWAGWPDFWSIYETK